MKRQFLRSTTRTHANFLGETFKVDTELLFGMFDASSKKGIIGHRRLDTTFSFGGHDELRDGLSDE